MLHLGPRGSRSLEHGCPRVQHSTCGAEEGLSCCGLFVAVVVPSMRTEGRVLWDFFFFFFNASS